MIGWRGPLAVLIGTGFLALVAAPEQIVGEHMPLPLRIFVGAFFLMFIVMGVYACVFTLRRNRLLTASDPEPCQIAVDEKDPDDSCYVARLRFRGEMWSVPLVARRSARALVGLGFRPADAWFDRRTGQPFAIRVEGQLLETLPVIQRESSAK